MPKDAYVLDACAVEQLMGRAYKPVEPRLIVPEQAFKTRTGGRRFPGFHKSGWAPPRTEIMDTRGIPEITKALELQASGLSDCQAAGLVIAAREKAAFVTKACDVLRARAEPLVGPDGVVDVSALWTTLRPAQ